VRESWYEEVTLTSSQKLLLKSWCKGIRYHEGNKYGSQGFRKSGCLVYAEYLQSNDMSSVACLCSNYFVFLFYFILFYFIVGFSKSYCL
jgi:hypothetical protein